MPKPVPQGRWLRWTPPAPTPPLIAAVLDALARLSFACAVEDVDAVRAAFAARTGAVAVELVEPGARVGLTDLFGTAQEAALSWDQLMALVPPGPMSDELGGLTGGAVVDGIACPVTGSGGCRAVLLVLFGQRTGLSAAEADLLVLLAQGFWLCLTRLRREADAARPVVLTAREVECLGWVLEGKTNWEIGVLTGVAPRTVQFHLANAARKLDATNRVQAGVKALMAGLVAPPRGLSWPRGSSSGMERDPGLGAGSDAVLRPGPGPRRAPSDVREPWRAFDGLPGAAGAGPVADHRACPDPIAPNDDSPLWLVPATVTRLVSRG
jgi:DNA-binding CsgD family transcriptional regulator